MSTAVPPFAQWPPTGQPPTPPRRVLPFDGLPQPNIGYCPGWRLQSFYFGDLLTMESVSSGAPAGGFGASSLQQLDWRALVAFANANHPADNWGVTILHDQSGNGRDLAPLVGGEPFIWTPALLAPTAVGNAGNVPSYTSGPLGQHSVDNGLGRTDASGIAGDPALTLALACDNFQSAGSGFEPAFTVGGLHAPELAVVFDPADVALFVLDINAGTAVGWDLSALAGYDMLEFHRYVVTKTAGSGYDLTHWHLRIDGVAIGLPTPGLSAPGPLNVTNGQTTLYSMNDATNFGFQGRIALLAVWTRVLTDAQLAQVEGFLNVI